VLLRLLGARSRSLIFGPYVSSSFLGNEPTNTSPKRPLSDEKDEENYMLQVLKKSVMEADLVGDITCRGGFGRPDALTLRDEVELPGPELPGTELPGTELPGTELPGPEDIGLVIEFKSTHNLPLHMAGSDVVEAYNEAYQHVMVERVGRTPAWSRVCHLIGQLLGYMVENGRRYGVLSSATRAYFLYIEGDGLAATVRISNPWFVGAPNFLREWA
jgi:hypothetical protein